MKVLNESIFENERVNALANYLDVNPSEIHPESFDENCMTLDDGREYLVISEGEQFDYVKEDIENCMDDVGIEAFTESFQDWIIKHACNFDSDWFDEAMDESNRYYADDIREEGSDAYANRLIEEMVERGILLDEEAQNIDEFSTEFDAKVEEFIESLNDDYANGFEWYKENFGMRDLTEMIRKRDIGLTFDMDTITKECIDWDGVAHFISRYDGKEIDLGNGLYAYRNN